MRQPGSHSRSTSSTAQRAGVAVILAGIVGVFLLAVAALRELSGGERWSHQNITTSQARAEAIVGALQSFKAGHGEYPAALGELVPGLLAEIPPPTAGLDRWKYERPAPGEFWLGFAAGDNWYPYAAYRSGRGWIIDQ